MSAVSSRRAICLNDQNELQFGQMKVPLSKVTSYEVLDKTIVRVRSDAVFSSYKLEFDLMCITADEVNRCVQILQKRSEIPTDSPTFRFQIYPHQILNHKGKVMQENSRDLVFGIKGTDAAKIVEKVSSLSEILTENTIPILLEKIQLHKQEKTAKGFIRSFGLNPAEYPNLISKLSEVDTDEFDGLDQMQALVEEDKDFMKAWSEMQKKMADENPPISVDRRAPL